MQQEYRHTHQALLHVIQLMVIHGFAVKLLLPF